MTDAQHDITVLVAPSVVTKRSFRPPSRSWRNFQQPTRPSPLKLATNFGPSKASKATVEAL